MTTGRVVTLGEALAMLRVTDLGGFELAETATIGTGGAEANVAIGLARLGVDVSWLGRVGDDALGRRVRRQLRAEGVHVVAVTDPDAPTGLMLKDSPRPGRTTVKFYRAGSAGSRLNAGDVDLLRVQDARWLHVTGIPLGLSPTAAKAIAYAVDVARDHGATVSFDINHRATLWDSAKARPAYREMVCRADIVFGGEDELAMITAPDLTPIAMAHAVADLGPQEVIVKCGAAGAGALNHGTWEWRDAVPAVTQDTVGAGDAFVAGYIAARLTGPALDHPLDLAVRAGAAACEHPGDWEGALYRHELRAPATRDPVHR